MSIWIIYIYIIYKYIFLQEFFLEVTCKCCPVPFFSLQYVRQAMSIIQNGVRGTANQGVPGIQFKNVGTNGGRCQEPFGSFDSLVLGGELSI